MRAIESIVTETQNALKGTLRREDRISFMLDADQKRAFISVREGFKFSFYESQITIELERAAGNLPQSLQKYIAYRIDHSARDRAIHLNCTGKTKTDVDTTFEFLKTYLEWVGGGWGY